MPDQKENIYETMAKVMADVAWLGKDQRNSGQGFNFRGIDDVMSAFGPAMRKHGLMALPQIEDMQRSDRTTRNGGLASVTLVKLRLAFVNRSGEVDAHTVVWGESMDSGDKSMAKAHSVALRTAYLQAFCLPTDEPDPDMDTYEITEPAEEPDEEEREMLKQVISDCETSAQAKELWDDAVRLNLTDHLNAIGKALTIKEKQAKHAQEVEDAGAALGIDDEKEN